MDKNAPPLVLVTRPAPLGAQFANALRTVVPDLHTAIAPAFAIAPVPHQTMPFHRAVFTSQAAVEYAPHGAGRVAYCVGLATAKVAQGAGYVPVYANGTADDLLPLILDAVPTDQPDVTLLHFRGRSVRVNIAKVLRARGRHCDDVVVYEKAPCEVDADVQHRIAQADRVILPAFSAETVSILTNWPIELTRCEAVAISAHVADRCRAVGIETVHLSDRIDLDGMVQATLRLIA